jgi:hypothetical protein
MAGGDGLQIHRYIMASHGWRRRLADTQVHNSQSWLEEMACRYIGT